MSILNASAALRMNFMSPPLLPPSPTFSKIHTETWATTRITTRTARTLVISPSFAMKNETSKHIDKVEEDEEVEEEMEESRETLLYSFTPLPLFFMAAFPGGKCCYHLLFKTWVNVSLICQKHSMDIVYSLCTRLHFSFSMNFITFQKAKF